MLEPLLVEDLIKNPLIKKSSEFYQLNPEISIILPTYCRGKSGLFKKCVDSILSQTFNNFELIIVDDASSDGTEDVIIDYINIDPRIICIRHEKNVGLPAISSYEAFKISRANKIFFAFDDNFYSDDALEILYQDQIKNLDHLITFAATKMHFSDQKSVILGNEDFKYEKIINHNYIPNSPMLIDKSIIADIGFYDPHICISRLCDWDLWIRISAKYNFYRIDKILADELGPSQADSLGNTHKLDLSLVREWICANRNEKLKIENFHRYDIHEVPKILSFESSAKIFTIIQKKELNSSKLKNYVVVISESEISHNIIFSYIPNEVKNRIIYISYESIRDFGYRDLILNANAVIFLSKICEISIFISQNLKLNSTPYYYFADENLFTSELKKINDFLKNAEAILSYSTETLKYLGEKKFNENNLIFEPFLNTLFQSFNNKYDFSHFHDLKEINFCFFNYSDSNKILDLMNLFLILKEDFKINLYCFGNAKDEAYKEAKEIYKKNNIALEIFAMENNFLIASNKLKSLKIHFAINADKGSDFKKNINEYNKINSIIAPTLCSSIILFHDFELCKKINLFNSIYSDNESFTNLVKKFVSDFNFLENTHLEQMNYCLRTYNNIENYHTLEKIINTQKKHNALNFINSFELENIQIKFIGIRLNLKLYRNKKYKLFKIICISCRMKSIEIKLFGIALVKIKLGVEI